MSQDFQLAHPCPHLIIEEPVDLGSDKRSLNTRAPVSAVGSVRVLANNSYYIPPQGLLSPAQITGSVAGPFNISGCGYNIVTLTAPLESVTFTLPIGARITTETLVTQFNKELTYILAENVNGSLVFTDLSNLGPSSKIKISGLGADSLGFQYQKGAVGKVVYPPWKLVNRSDIIRNYYPQFTSRVKQSSTFKVTYTAPVSRCLRCRATYTENDYRFNLQGEPLLIENENLLYQAALKILLTGKGSNPFHPLYGSTIKSRIGTKAVGAVVTLLNEDVRFALTNMQQLQAGQARYQTVSAKERLFRLLTVEVTPHEHDPTAFKIDVVVSNASGEPVNISIVFSVSGVAALTGSNDLSLGLDLTGLSERELQQFFAQSRI